MPISDKPEQPEEDKATEDTEEVPEKEGEEVVIGDAVVEEGPSTSTADPLAGIKGKDEEEDKEEEDEEQKDDENYEPEGMTEEEYLQYINKDGAVS